MQFNRTGQHDDRRRRLLNEETAEGEAAPKRGDGSSRAPRPLSHEASLMEGLPRVIDLAPRRYLTLALWFVAGILTIAALEGLYWWMPQAAHLTTDGSIEAFDLDGEGTLAVWFSSFLLTLSGFTALLIFSVRRRQVDDYSARYRVWLWAAGCWFLLSLDETASLHESFKELMSWATGTRLYGDGSVWWVIAYGLLLGQVGLVLWLEMKTCLSSRLSLVGTAVCFVTAIVAQIDVFEPWLGVRGGIMLEEGAEMLGDLLLLLGMCLHARHVILALGPRREAKKKRAEAAAEKEAEASKAKGKPAASTKAKPEVKADAKPEVPPKRPESAPAKPLAAEAAKAVATNQAKQQPPANPQKPAASGGQNQAAGKPDPNKPHVRVDDAEELGGTHRKLTKAERKALKRERSGGRYDQDDE